MRVCAVIAMLAVPALGAEFRFVEHVLEKARGTRIAGAAWHRGVLITWGDSLVSTSVPEGERRVLRASGPPFTEGGCLHDVDGDGRADIVLNERAGVPELVWFQAPHWRRRVIARNVDAADIIPAGLLGHRGVLLIHRRMQVRFYEIPSDPGQLWPSRDLYSIYTPSWQGGLLLADIDRDGRTDILCGNYWIRSPENYDLPWRLFAINTWTEEESSGMMRLFFDGSRLLAAQREMSPARLAWFRRPADPTAIWPEKRLGIKTDAIGDLDLADFDGDGKPEILLGEKGGGGRLMILSGDTVQELARGAGVVFARAVDLNRDGRPDIIVARKDSISFWEAASRR